MNKYKELYNTNKDFKEYVDNCMSNKNVTLEQVLSLKITQMVADSYEKESNGNIS